MCSVKLFGPVKVGCNAARVMAIGPPWPLFFVNAAGFVALQVHILSIRWIVGRPFSQPNIAFYINV